MSSCYYHLLGANGDSSILSCVWSILAPPNVIDFTAVTIEDSILTMDHSQGRQKIIFNGCPLRLTNVESIDQLLINVLVAKVVFSAICLGAECPGIQQ